MSTVDQEVAAAAATIRRNDEGAARAAFALLVAHYGRREASGIWVHAQRLVETEGCAWLDLPSKAAPDCVMGCGETTITEGCEPCTVMDEIRHPAPATDMFTCDCGIDPIPQTPNRYEEIFDHVEACPLW